MVKFIKENSFSPIRLEEMERVKLMNRTDTKYWFHERQLQDLLSEIQDDYFMLFVHNKVVLPYSTVYYDTPENNMFINHHNGKLNRFKIRRRSYDLSNISFLEVKFKNNKGRTIKKRVAANFGETKFSNEEKEFLSKHIPFKCDHLQPSLINNFTRITLVNKNFQERCTIDLNLGFRKGTKKVLLNNLVIVEIKSEGSPTNSPLARALRDERIKSSGFSKYCVGRTVTDSSIKRNAFKAKIRRIEKTIEIESNLYNIT